MNTNVLIYMLTVIALKEHPIKAACSDGYANCGYWSTVGQCDINPNWMSKNCPVTCAASCQCPGVAYNGFLADTRCDCQGLAQDENCEQGSSVDYMKQNCATTCGIRAVTSCDSPPTIRNSVFTNKGNSKWMALVTYECAPYAYTLSTDSNQIGTRVCQRKGTWYRSQKDPECYVKNCTDVPVDIKNSKWTADPPSQADNSFLYRTIVTYSCLTGYERKSGDSQRRCDADASKVGFTSWTPIVCEKKKCGHPPVVSNSTAGISGTLYQDSITYTCDDGFTLADGKNVITITCQASATWSLVPKCLGKDCATPPKVENANFTYTSTRHPNYVNYLCNNGYTFISNDKLWCNEKGEWAGAVVKCTLSASSRRLWLYAGIPMVMVVLSVAGIFAFICMRHQQRQSLVKELTGSTRFY